ncbi:hypothetical protein SLEP1_g21247 [Rubroshorea leprosula]|uniref:Uncharacterized protein n=1 Tax=Rubroshorea leprosula TaxID=152421 RepID=A0AAV5J8J3_9ROSI|nr:hypothetical protein SLEP1_g21247 [Rubroshorea leprosula]
MEGETEEFILKLSDRYQPCIQTTIQSDVKDKIMGYAKTGASPMPVSIASSNWELDTLCKVL